MLQKHVLPVTVFLRRFYSSTASQHQVKLTDISKSLKLRELDQSDGNVTSNSDYLVLMFDWLYAKPAHLNKYCQLYHDKGLDVLTIHGKLAHFLWPPRGAGLAEELMKYLLETRQGKDKLIVHAFSVGAYNYTICKQKALDQPELYERFRTMVSAQVFDSIVLGITYENMSTGISEALSPSTRKPIIKLMDTYYNLTKKTTKDTYDKLVSTFKTNPICVPTIFFYSHNDPMCDLPSMQALEQKWKEEFPDLDARFKSWETSGHAAHIKFHETEYLEEWNKLMTKLKLKNFNTM
ncbi:hypothetical protein FSP39_004961 [Pinctada imbricata]|uniref:Uncharacterized protein n=1 Tax=Pinctada imbricata TaxID=66713 RepID=A0AA88Y7K7_PINIB|nr:hypothetical protein FSP39_004961 [Pinctada imbricata]